MAKKDKVEKKRGVGTAAQEAIKAGMTNVEALEAVQKEFPDCKTSLASMNWYRNRMRAAGVKGVKTNRELTKKAAKTKDPLDN